MPPRPRPILYPLGQSAREDVRDRCLEMVRRLGGDLSRVTDSPSATLDEFVTHIGRIKKNFIEREPPIVVLTKITPLTLMVVSPRKRLVESAPVLVHSEWIIYYDPIEDPQFLSAANDLGSFDRDFKHAPYWVGPGELRFLVLSPFIDDMSILDQRITMRAAKSQ